MEWVRNRLEGPLLHEPFLPGDVEADRLGDEGEGHPLVVLVGQQAGWIVGPTLAVPHALHWSLREMINKHRANRN